MMEKRAILAFALSMVLLVLYMWVQNEFFASPPPAKEGNATPAVAPPPVAKPGGAPPPPPKAAEPQPAAPAPPAQVAAESTPKARPPQRTVRVDAPLYHAVVSSEGGKLQEWTLRYRGEKPMVVVGEAGPGGLMVMGAETTRGEPVPMSILEGQAGPGEARKGQEVVLGGEAEGLSVRQTLRFQAESYAVSASLRIENRTSAPRKVSVVLPWSTRQHWGEGLEKFNGQRATEVVWSSQGQVERVEDLTKVEDRAVEGEWVGVGSVWYLAALIPRTPGWQVVTGSTGKPPDAKNGKETWGRVTVAVRAMPTIAPGQSWEGQVVLYAGPKEYERLRALGLEETINFGGFPLPRRWGGLPMEWVGVPILLLMKWVYRYVGNYGVAIILITVLSKVLFYPLTVKSIRSMKAMQALQPQVNALRTKHKSDPPRAQREMMELYRKHKVNPMGGCLPMVAQVPVFYALYLALSVAVELQSAAFLCFGRVVGADVWICDLASQDPTYVLPVLMGVTMFVQQKMTPTTGDPRQAKMMLVMPFVFTFMFLNLPSGLVLYWTVSNVLQIVQQWYMDRPRARAVREAKDASRA